MKLIFAAFVLIVCATVCAFSSEPVPADPKRAVAPVKDPYVWDFGSARAGDILEHEFILSNDSAKDLAVKDVTTSCGCTVSEIKNKLLKPGESTTVSVKFDTKGYSGAATQFIYVSTDNAVDPVIRFTVKANVSS